MRHAKCPSKYFTLNTKKEKSIFFDFSRNAPFLLTTCLKIYQNIPKIHKFSLKNVSKNSQEGGQITPPRNRPGGVSPKIGAGGWLPHTPWPTYAGDGKMEGEVKNRRKLQKNA